MLVCACLMTANIPSAASRGLLQRLAAHGAASGAAPPRHSPSQPEQPGRPALP
eukprot:CAMPEP_0206238470 /NCGR_PEP_ID=MMETSP0047_2-20121206/14837_1 /ASSEMBLY_ACC=CAM_ASM_000192 /TAXON_ID=195065 /ORGANISM="Chroomonas mesostigmatica_cf, Strain CCMP1168" /LENGTH=52 /DNA_ID=CAMNT_0053663017 /DNA_START=342 /DNA_END=497 /DNA_ORIENTATION=-